jgi:hypothetical protein
LLLCFFIPAKSWGQNKRCVIRFDDTTSKNYISAYIPYFNSKGANPIQLVNQPGLLVSCTYVNERGDSITAMLFGYDYEFRRNGKVYFKGRVNQVTFDKTIKDLIIKSRDNDSLIAYNFDLRVPLGDTSKRLTDEKRVFIDTFKLKFSRLEQGKYQVELSTKEKKFNSVLYKNQTFYKLIDSYGQSSYSISGRHEPKDFMYNAGKKMYSKRFLFFQDTTLKYDFTFEVSRDWEIKAIYDNVQNKKYTLKQWELQMKSIF